MSRAKGRPQASPRYLNILTPLSFFDNVLLFQGHRGWMPRRACMISLFGKRFFRQKIGKVFRPVHINPAPSSGVLNPSGKFSLTLHPCSRAAGYSGRCWIKWRTIRPYAFLLHTPSVSFPKTTGLFGGIGDIHDFHQRTLFYFNRLDKNQAYNNRRNYHIII